MNGNSFNICPRCGNSNSLNAKYCSRCGAQLKVPEETVVCHKCHTRNTPMANFCRNCGATLKVGSATKICPKCGKEVNAEDNICVCGYSFVTMQQTMPSSVPVETTESTPAETTEVTEKKVYNTKGGRGWAIAALFLILLFAYYLITPFALYNRETGETLVTLRPEFLVQLDRGFINIEVDEGVRACFYGYDFIGSFIYEVLSGAPIGEVLAGANIANMMILALVVVFIITALVHFIVAFVRCFTTKRSKKMNWYFLIMAILSSLVVGLIALFNYVEFPEGFMTPIAEFFKLPDGYSLGFAIYALPLYFWFFFLYSLGAKAKVLKEKAA